MSCDMRCAGREDRNRGIQSLTLTHRRQCGSDHEHSDVAQDSMSTRKFAFSGVGVLSRRVGHTVEATSRPAEFDSLEMEANDSKWEYRSKEIRNGIEFSIENGIGTGILGAQSLRVYCRCKCTFWGRRGILMRDRRCMWHDEGRKQPLLALRCWAETWTLLRPQALRFSVAGPVGMVL
jgi:hypothetical protein